MADLIAKTPCAGALPFENTAVQINEVHLGEAFIVAAYTGQSKAVSKALKAQFDLGLPSANGVVEGEQGHAIWVGPDRALLVVDTMPDLAGAGAVTAQGDGIAAVNVRGEKSVDVMARLTPIDLRLTAFPIGETRRTMINHMMASIIRESENGFDLHVMRSMATTLVEELTEAARHVASRD